MQKALLAMVAFCAGALLIAAPDQIAVLATDPLATLSGNAPAGWKRYETKLEGKSGTIAAAGNAIKMIDDGPGEIGFSRVFKVKPGSFVRASVDARLTSDPAAPEGMPFVLQITFPKAKQSSSVKLEAGKEFTNFFHTREVPADNTEMIVYLYSHKPPVGGIEVKNFKLEESAAAFPAAPAKMSSSGSVTLEAEAAKLNSDRVEVVDQGNFVGGKGVSLKAGVKSTANDGGGDADLTFKVKAPQPGLYEILTNAATDAKGAEEMRRANSKFASMYAKIQIDDRRPTRRVIFVPWSKPEFCTQNAGKFQLTGEEQEIKFSLPEGLRLDNIQVRRYTPPAVPKEAAAYKPVLVPPKSRPRLWMNAESLPAIRANLTKGENLAVWNKLKAEAEKPFEFKFDPDKEVSFNTSLERAAANKAFVCLMTGDEKLGREAIKLTCDYISRVEFGNLLDITREIGSALYSAARVYDWCYNLMTPEERDIIRKNMMRLIIDMECGWPPFLQSIVNGHGNEAQINRDLLSMAIAIYDEDPVPYQYCSYAILEQLVPMRKFEYQSPRHNQGVGYGSYRFGWDMHSAWLFRRMLGKEIFDPNIKDVRKYWQYMRLPDGEMLRDGDGISAGKYWGAPMTMLLCYSYAADPVLKGEFERQGGLAYDPVLYLTLNDPDLKAEKSLKSLPLTIDFGPVLSGMVMRTGWNIGRGSSDVVAEIKGGGTHFGNHQHSDAGSFQIYYRGLQAAKLGQYKFYGTPYDMNFAKRSISQPMMLVVDPAENFRYSQTNDGGVRFIQTNPRTAKDAMENPEFNNGKKISGSFGPSPMRPLFSYFSVSLKGAYSAKVTDYVRSFCFLNLGNDKVPAAIIVLDDLTAAKAEFKKYWQINGLCQPELTPDGVILSNNRLGAKGKLVLSMVKPAPADRKVEVLTGEDANSVFGKKFTPPYDSPEAHGSRVMFSPAKAAANDVFLSVIQLVDGDSRPLPYEAKETDFGFTVSLADRFVAMVKGSKLLDRAFTVSVPAGAKVLAAGLAPGQWFVAGPGAGFNATVEVEKNTVFFVSEKGGSYTFTPGGKKDAPAQKVDTTLEPPEVSGLADNAVAVYDKILPGLTTRKGRGFFLVPAAEVFKALGAEVKDADGMLAVSLDGRKAVFQNHSSDFTLEGQRFVMNGAAARQDGVWWIPDQVIAGLSGSALVRDEVSSSVAFTKLATKRNPLLLWAEVSSGEGLEELIACVGEPGNSGKYFAFSGSDVYFRLALAKPVKLRGVGIHFLSGAARKYKFKLEVAGPDGKYETVFNGESSGGKEGTEEFTFAPREVSQIKYTGYGNSENNWNSIVNIKLLE